MSSSNFVIKLNDYFSMEMIRIPAGKFLMGSDKTRDKYAAGNEAPQHSVHLDDYWIGKYPVTIGQYRQFVHDTGYRPPEKFGNLYGSVNTENRPVSGVGRHDARAFCYWLHRQTKEFVCIPTEAEWEKAARGPNGFIWPWGNQPLDVTMFKNKEFGSDQPLGLYSPATDSPYGCVDMVTNITELCNTAYNKGFLSFYNYPYDMNDGREGTKSNTQRAMRGGGLYQLLDIKIDQLRAARRQWALPADAHNFMGFRVIITKSAERWKVAFPDQNEKAQLEAGLHL